MLLGALRDPHDPLKTKKKGEGARRGQEGPGGARRGQEEPEEARRNQEEPGGARKSQGFS